MKYTVEVTETAEAELDAAYRWLLAVYLLDHPDLANQIPDGALVVFVPAFDKELARRNRALARK